MIIVRHSSADGRMRTAKPHLVDGAEAVFFGLRQMSSTEKSSPARVTLPSDLAGSLKYLDDAQLRRLREAVTVEINRRNQGAPEAKTAAAAATGTSPQGQFAASRNEKTRAIEEIPEGRANLIRASFRAGIKPAAIARTFHLPQSLVTRVLSAITEKPKR
jgi:hypothetical protein